MENFKTWTSHLIDSQLLYEVSWLPLIYMFDSLLWTYRLIVLIIYIIYYLTSTCCSRRIVTKLSCWFHFNYLGCWIISGKRWTSKSPFCERTADEWKLILNVQKCLYHLETWISLTKFERVSIHVVQTGKKPTVNRG